MSEQSREATEVGSERTSARNVDPGPTPHNASCAATVPPEKQEATGAGRRKLLLGALAVLILAGALWFGIPWVQTAVDTATADLQVAKSKVRGLEAEAMSRRRALEHAMEDVDNQVALLRAKVAGLDKSQAQLALAQVDFDRAAKLVVTNDTPRSEYDRRQAILLSARADVVASRADIRQIRASLGLPQESDEADLGRVPPDINQTFSSVLQAQAALIQSAAQLGVIHSFEEGPRRMVGAFEKEGNVNTTFTRLAAEAPDVKQAEAKLEAAKHDLDQAGLYLGYCAVF